MLTLTMIFLLMPGSVMAADVVASGNCGDHGSNVKWQLTSDGTLTIYGTGAMADYIANETYPPSNNTPPWNEIYSYPPQRVIIESGVTGIGEYAFRDIPDLKIYGYRGTSAEAYAAKNGVPFIPLADTPFTDVLLDAYYADAVVWALEKGVTSGASDTTFTPGKDCTRGEFVTFLYRYLG